MDEDNEMNVQLVDPANVPHNDSNVPGAVIHYELPDFDVEEPFEPITMCAILESGRLIGPLNEVQLIAFLRHKLDMRQITTKDFQDLINKYTTNVLGFYQQLKNLRNRIKEIQDEEKRRSDCIKTRIKHLEKAEKDRKKVRKYIPEELSSAAREAFFRVGDAGLLSEDELKVFVNTGVRDQQFTREEIIQQLKDLRLRIHENLDVENHNRRFFYDRIVKAIEEITQQCLEI